MIDGLHVRQDRRSGRRETGHRLEERVDRPVELRLAGQEVRDRTEDGGEQPRERDDEIGLAEADGGRVLSDASQPEPGGERDHGGREERPGRLAIDDRDDGRHEGRDAEVLDERAGEAERGPEVDREPWTACCRRPSAGGSIRPPGRHRTRSTSGTRSDSVNTITRSPACRVSSLRGKTASPSRTMAPISAPRIGISRKRSPTYSLVGRS